MFLVSEILLFIFEVKALVFISFVMSRYQQHLFMLLANKLH